MWSDSSAHWNHSKGPLFWEAIRPPLVSGKFQEWSLWHRNVLVKLVSRDIWTQDRLSRLRDEDSCQLCHEGPGTMCHRCCECPAQQTERDVQVPQEVRQAARSLGLQHREQFEQCIFPSPAAILPTGSPERACPVLWHNRPPDGLLEEHIFTGGAVPVHTLTCCTHNFLHITRAHFVCAHPHIFMRLTHTHGSRSKLKVVCGAHVVSSSRHLRSHVFVLAVLAGVTSRPTSPTHPSTRSCRTFPTPKRGSSAHSARGREIWPPGQVPSSSQAVSPKCSTR